jgi:hypothetical protein
MRTAIKKTAAKPAAKMKTGGVKKKMQTGGTASASSLLDKGKKKKKSSKGMENVYGKDFKRNTGKCWGRGN